MSLPTEISTTAKIEKFDEIQDFLALNERIEKFHVTDFCRKEIFEVASDICQQNQIREAQIFSCPRCGTDQPEPNHGVPGQCAMSCGVEWVSFGNILNLWLTEWELRKGWA